MRYLITSIQSEQQVILGYDEKGLLCEVQVSNAADEKALEWSFRHAPIHEADVRIVFKQDHLRFTTLKVTFDEFWRTYRVKEGKKDAMRSWEKLTDAQRQLAFNYIETYRSKCIRDRISMQYPATYLRAERWLDHT